MRRVCLILLFSLTTIALGAQTYDQKLFGGMHWRNIGPFRGGRALDVTGIPGEPNTYFFCAVAGGVWKSTDGRAHWKPLFHQEPTSSTGAIDVVFDPNNANILFASLWQVTRTPYSLDSGGPGSGLYKSSDGGTTWRRLEGNGLPDGIMGRIGVSVSGGDSTRVYALIEAEKGGLYRSDDAGDHWIRVNEDERYRQRAWYFTHIFADPKSIDTVYVLNTGLFRSTDGGKTFALLPAPHGDHHGLWIDPRDP